MQKLNEQIPLQELQASSKTSDERGMLVAVQPTGASLMALRIALDLPDAKAQAKEVAMAIVANKATEVARHCAERERLTAEIDSKRRNYKWWQDLFRDPEAQAKLLKEIAAAAELLKSEVAKIPEFQNLRQVEMTYGRKAALAQIIPIISWADAQINSSTKLSNEQIVTIAQAVLVDYGSLRIEDVAAIVKRNILHASAPMMRLDTQSIMAWFRKYKEEQDNEAALANYNKHLATK